MTSTEPGWSHFGLGRRRLSVGAKFGLIIALCTALVMAATTAAITERFRAQDEVRSEAIARAAASRICLAVQGVFESAFDIVNNTHDDLLALKDAGITDSHVYDTILKRMIEAGSDRYGAWLVWDGDDAPADATRSRGIGARFDVYWHQNGMEMLRDALPAEILSGSLYRIPRENGKAYLLDPHVIAAVNGDPTLVTSFAMPVVHDGKIVGALDLDLKLDAITDALSSISLPDGASITVVSDGGSLPCRRRNATSAHRWPRCIPISPRSSRSRDAATDRGWP